MKWKWLLPLAPLALGLGLDLLLNWNSPALPVVFMRADVGSLALLLGITGGIAWGAMLLMRARTRRKEQQNLAALEAQADDDRRRFLRRLDHELKNPLTAIRAGIVNVREAPGMEAREEALCSVDAQAVRLSRLAADLRKLAELETRAMERVEVDLAGTLQEAFHLAQDKTEAAERTLAIVLPHAPWPLPKIQGDQDLLFLAVHNLLDNAIKFTHPGDTIEMRAFEDGQSVVIEVADTGPGIPEDELPHVWEELYRGNGARGIPGSGLGLALVRAIAERHNGVVSLRSKAGKGTVFSLRLPVG